MPRSRPCTTTSSSWRTGRSWQPATIDIVGNGGEDVAKRTTAVALPTPEAVVAEFAEKRHSAGLLDLIRAADRGDKQALSHLRLIYEAVPAITDAVSSWQYSVERDIMGTAQPGATETLAAQANRLRKRLAGDDPSPLESVLVNRVVLDHLHALNCEQTLQQKLAGSVSLAQGEYFHKQAERAQRRLLRSTKALAEVRRLLRPTVQINVAEQQVVAGTVNTGSNQTA